MNMPNERPHELDDFGGRARIFPLPNLVMFPHVVQPLHIFEPRYREMMADALAGDGLIAMGLLTPGWEQDYEGRPPMESVICLGKVASHTLLPDGKYNLLLSGLIRAEIKRELPAKRSFRIAEVELLDDFYPPEFADQRPALRQRLLDRFSLVVGHSPQSRQQIEMLRNREIPLGVLTDVVSYALDIGLPQKQTLLAESNVDERAALLLEYLDHFSGTPPRGKLFPPNFSSN